MNMGKHPVNRVDHGYNVSLNRLRVNRQSAPDFHPASAPKQDF
jgi:hypothetical protein